MPKDDNGKPTEFTWQQALTERVLSLALSIGVALCVKDLGFVVDVIGAVAVLPTMTLFPGALQLRLHDILMEQEPGRHIPWYNSRSRFWGWATIVFGVVLSITSLTLSVLDQVGVNTDGH